MKALLLNPEAEYQDGYELNRDNYIEVTLLAYDRDKYVLVQLPYGTEESFKSGYIKRHDNFGYLTNRQLFSLPVLTWGDEKFGTMPTKRDVQKELRENYKHKTTFKLIVQTYQELNLDGIKGADSVSISIEVPTLKKAIQVFRKYKSAQLMFKSNRFNYEGIAEYDPFLEGGTLMYDVNHRNNRPTYSAKVLRELAK